MKRCVCYKNDSQPFLDKINAEYGNVVMTSCKTRIESLHDRGTFRPAIILNEALKENPYSNENVSLLASSDLRYDSE